MVSIIHKLIYMRTDEDSYFHLRFTCLWKLLPQIPKTFSIPVCGLHIILINLNLTLCGGKTIFCVCTSTSGSFVMIFDPGSKLLRRVHSVAT